MAKTMQMAGLLLSTSSEPERGQGDGRGELADRTGRNDRKGGWDWGSRGGVGGGMPAMTPEISIQDRPYDQPPR